MSFAAVVSLSDFQAHVRAGLGDVRAPTLLIHARHDHTAPFACMATLARGLGTSPTEIRQVVLERSFHVITLDVERQMVFDAVRNHVLAY
jgi:carboxylesterase